MDLRPASVQPKWGSTGNADTFANVSRKEIIIGDLIGKGRFKHVHRATLRQRDVVVLKYTATKDQDQNELRMLQVLANSKSIHHVPEIYGSCVEDDSTTLVVQERALHGSLKAAMKDPAIMTQVSTLHLTFASYQFAKAMAFLESIHIIHADLSCRNLLLYRFEAMDPCALIVKLTDFGLAILLENGARSISKKQPQATRWCAPETVSDLLFSHATDVWSYGATIWEIFAGGVAPWPYIEKRMDVGVRLKRLAKKAKVDSRAMQRDFKILTIDFPRPDHCPEFVHSIILSCLHVFDTKRPSFSNLVEQWAEQLPVKSEIEEEVTTEEGSANPMDDNLDDVRESFSESQSELSTETPSTLARPSLSCFEIIEPSSTLARLGVSSCNRTPCRYKALEDFLWSEKAIELLGEEMAFGTRTKIEAVKTQLAERERIEAHVSKREAIPAEVKHQRQSQHWSGPPWTLWTYSDSALHQDVFASEGGAWIAYRELRATGRPCVLRDPFGWELAAFSWVSKPARTLRTIRIG